MVAKPSRIPSRQQAGTQQTRRDYTTPPRPAKINIPASLPNKVIKESMVPSSQMPESAKKKRRIVQDDDTDDEETQL